MIVELIQYYEEIIQTGDLLFTKAITNSIVEIIVQTNRREKLTTLLTHNFKRIEFNFLFLSLSLSLERILTR